MRKKAVITDYFPLSSPSSKLSQPSHSSPSGPSKQKMTRSPISSSRNGVERFSDPVDVIEISSDSSPSVDMSDATRVTKGQTQRVKPTATSVPSLASKSSRKRTQSNASSQLTSPQNPKRQHTIPKGSADSPIVISSDDEIQEIPVTERPPNKIKVEKRSSPIKPSRIKIEVDTELENNSATLVQDFLSSPTEPSPAPSSKRSATESSLDSPLPSAKRPRMSLNTNHKSLQPTSPQVIPSSEGEDEMDLLPMDRSFVKTHETDFGHTPSRSSSRSTSSRGSKTPLSAVHKRASSRTPSEIETSQLIELEPEAQSKRPSLSRAQSSIQSAILPVTPSRHTAIAESSSAVGSAKGASFPTDADDDISDAESLDSVKQAKRAMARVNMIQDDDEDEDDLPDTIDLLEASKVPNKGKAKVGESALASHIKRAQNSLITSSPLTSPSCKTRPVNVKATGLRTSGTVEVVIPKLTEVQRQRLHADVYALPKPTLEVNSSRNSKTLQNDVLAGLLKEKKVSEKKYPLNNPREESGGSASLSNSVDPPMDSKPGNSDPDFAEQKAKVTGIIQSDLKIDEQIAQAIDNFWSAQFWERSSAQPPDAEGRMFLTFPEVDTGKGHFAIIRKAAKDQRYTLLASLLQAGILNGVEEIPDAIFDWLLDLAVLNSTASVSSASVTCIRNLLTLGNHSAKQIQLDYSTVRRLLVGLGAKQDRLHLLPPGDNPDEEPKWFTSRERAERVVRLFEVINAFASVKQVYAADIPNILTRLSRWIAVGLLGGAVIFDEMKEDTFMKFPSFSLIVSIIYSGEHGTPYNQAYVSFVASDELNYQDLTYNADILGVALTGLDDSPEEQGKNRRDSTLDIIKQGLLKLHGWIVDDKGLGMKQTLAKDALLKLHTRVDYQTKKPGTILDFDELADCSRPFRKVEDRVQTKLTFFSKKITPA
ncbi:hypothetical protein FRC03_001039 [Tulasnella sp. 419]|nr:hypothetical protein FRC03_001039 [Tulasnella sp. 419]